VCDNFCRGAAVALHPPDETGKIAKRLTVLMNQELVLEYEKLSKKVHELREYL
jgi:hypothetical protein